MSVKRSRLGQLAAVIAWVHRFRSASVSIGFRLPAVDGQVAMRQKKREDTQRQVDEEDGPPTESGDENAAERWTESSAKRGHRSEQPHGATRLFLRNRLTDKGNGESHHDGRSEALRRPGGNQHPKRRCDAAEERCRREQEDPGEEQPSAAGDVAESPDADEQGGDGEEIGEDDPLDFREGGAEGLCSALPATTASRLAMIDFKMSSFSAGSRNGAVRNVLYSLVWHGGRRTSCTLFVCQTPCHDQAVLSSMHVDSRSQPAGHPRCTARRRQRRTRRPALAAQSVGDEPGVGALACDNR